MPKVTFKPGGQEVEVDDQTKIILAAKKDETVDLRFGCASCRCGLCAVEINRPESLSVMTRPEKELLERLKLSTEGKIRLACRAKVGDDVEVDLDFQGTYSPDSL